MGTARKLYARFRQLIFEAGKFGIVGIVGVFANLVITDVAHFNLGVGETASAFIGATITTVMSYVGNRYWSFKDRRRTGVSRESLYFVVLNTIGIVIQMLTVWLFKHGTDTSHGAIYTFANAVGIGLGTIFRWWSYRKWVWLAPSAPRDGSDHERLEPALASAQAVEEAREEP